MVGDPGRRRTIGNYHLYVTARRIVVDRALGRPLLLPGLEVVQPLERRNVVAVARRHRRANLAAAYALVDDAEKAAAELGDAQRLDGKGTFSSRARLKLINHGRGVRPEIYELFEATYFTGLRKAGDAGGVRPFRPRPHDRQSRTRRRVEPIADGVGAAPFLRGFLAHFGGISTGFPRRRKPHNP
jgi:hypothetical protein